MAAPTFVSIGTADNGVGALSVPWGAGHQADDIGLLCVQTANQTVATPAGWTPVGSSGVGTAGASGATAVWVFWKRATSTTEANVAVSDPGDHARGRIIVLRGCETSGSPFNGSVVTGTVASPTTAVSIAMPTTSVAECYAIAICANATLATSNQTTVGAWANAALESDFTRIINGNTNTGVGGGYDGAGGTKLAAGAIGNTTSTLNTASAQALISFALMPPQAGGGSVTEGGVFVSTGVKSSIGATGATTATMDTASVQALISIALKPAVSAPSNTAPILEQVPALAGAVGNIVQFPITVSDLEGDAITLSLEAGQTAVPTGAVLVQDEQSGNYAFEWTPTADQVGEWSFILRATDNNASPLSSTSAVVIVIRSGPVRPPFGALGGAVTGIT